MTKHERIVQSIKCISLDVPIETDCQDATFGIHVDIKLPPREANTLRRIAVALDKRQATIGNGRRVTADNVTSVIPWLLEQLSESILQSDDAKRLRD